MTRSTEFDVSHAPPPPSPDDVGEAPESDGGPTASGGPDSSRDSSVETEPRGAAADGIDGARARSENPFADYLGRHLDQERNAITRRWVEQLEEQLEVAPERVLPSEDLLNHIPIVLSRVAAFVRNPREGILEAMVVEDLGRLAELRRSQGFGLQELLREYHILSGIIQAEIEDACEAYPEPVRPRDAVAPVGRLKDAIHLLSAVTARSFHAWEARYEQERRELLETYGQIMSHELGNRLGAAETAVQILLSDIEVDEERTERLHTLIAEGLREGRRTIDDLRVLAEPVSPDDGESPSIDLRLLLWESTRFGRVTSQDTGVQVTLEGDVPEARVPGPPVRIALSNLLTNAVRYHRDEGDEDRWVRIRAERLGERAEIHVEDNGPGIPEDHRERVFDYRFRGHVESEGSGLGLAITREALQRVGGTIRLEDRPDGGCHFIVDVPAVPDDADA
jgi:signal transduction histidine kinase